VPHIALKSSVVRILSSVILILVTWGSVEAQTAPGAFAELGQRVKPGDTIFVTGRDSAETRGRLVRLSPTSLVMAIGGQEREIPSTEIGWIERRGDAVWDGALLGAFALGLSFAGGAGASCSPDCAKVVPTAALYGAAAGAVLGAGIDSLHPGRTVVYGTRPSVARSQLRERPPVTSLGDLFSRVRRGDTVYVRETSGQEIQGHFSRSSVSSLTIVVDGQLRDIPSDGVQQIRRRTSQFGRGLLVGPAIGAVIGALSPAQYQTRTASAVSGAFVGALVGGVVGGLLPHRSVVYQPGAQPAVIVMPVLAPGRSGVGLSVRF
jgi:hypothetical protein